jgi:hypothetical protein
MNRVGDFGHSMVAWRGGMAGLNNSDMLSMGFNSMQIQQIEALHASGALSDVGYQIIQNGFVSPGDLADFLAADPGAPQTTSGNAVPIASNISPTQAGQLTPGPAPRVAAPSSISSFFTGSTLIAGIPNMVVLGLAVLVLPMLVGGKRR